MKKLFVVIIFSLCLLISSCDNRRLFKTDIINFGTIISISVINSDEASSEKSFDEIKECLNILNNSWHAWHQSLLLDINNNFAHGKKTKIDNDIKLLINYGKDLYHKSLHLFNPAAGLLSAKWGFLSDDSLKSRNIANSQEIEKIVNSKPSMDDIIIEDDYISSNNKNVMLDVGGYAKGIAIQKIINILKKHNINDALINIGGDLTIIGKNKNAPWKVAISDPNSKYTPLAIVDLEKYNSIMTSGTYVRFFKNNKQTYHHIIDPRTGNPSKSNFISVTVIHDDPVLADAAATSILIAGNDEWQTIVKAMQIEKFLIIDNNKNLIASKPAYNMLTDFNKKSYNITIV